MSATSKRWRSYTGLVAGLVGTVVAAVYLVVITNQDENAWGRVTLVATTIALASAAAFTGSLGGSPRARFLLLTASATAFAVWGVLALFSIGAPLMGAAALAGIAAGGAAGRHEGSPGALAPWALLAVGAVVAATAAGLVLTAH